MKKLILILALLMPIIASAMKIEKDEIDEFTGKRTLITSWEGICKGEVHIRFRHQNGCDLLDFKYINGGAIVIGRGDKLMFKSVSDDIVDFTSIDIFSGTPGGGAVGISGSKAWGVKAIYEGNLSWFSDNVAKLFRVYATDGYRDKKISENDGRKLMKLYELFSKTLNNEHGSSSFADYTLTFVKRGANKAEWDIVSKEYKQDISKEELTDIVNEWKAKSNDKTIYDVKIMKEK